MQRGLNRRAFARGFEEAGYLASCPLKRHMAEEGHAAAAVGHEAQLDAPLAIDLDDDRPVVEMDPPEDAEEELQIVRVTVIRGGGMKADWMPKVQLVDNMEFVKLSKWDRDLTRYVSGRGLYLHKRADKLQHSINVKWFDEILALRKTECDKRLKEVICSAAVEAGETPPEKVRAAVADDEWLCGRHLALDLPPVPGHPGLSARVLWGVKGADLYMQLTTDNLKYVKAAILASEPSERRQSKKAPADDRQGPERMPRRPGRPRRAREQPQAEEHQADANMEH